MPQIAGTCEECKAPTLSYPSKIRRFCSKACAARFQAQSGMPTKPRTGRYMPCLQCQTDVWVMKSGEGRVKFCSQECKAGYESVSFEANCENCEVSMLVKPSMVGRRFCSKACEAEKRIKRPTGRLRNGKPVVIDHQGYARAYEPGHPAATRSGWVFEHRLVMEEAVGRYLARSENVHHINHIRHDNRLENLTMLSHSEHSKVTGRENGEALKAAIAARDRLAEYERRYGPLPED